MPSVAENVEAMGNRAMEAYGRITDRMRTTVVLDGLVWRFTGWNSTHLFFMADNDGVLMLAGLPHPNCVSYEGDIDAYYMDGIRSTRRAYRDGDYVGHL